RPRLREATVPESVGRDIRNAEPRTGDERGDYSGDLECPQHRTAPQDLRVGEWEGERSKTAWTGPAGSQNPDRGEQARIIRVVAQCLRQVGEVPDAVEGLRVGPEVPIEKPGTLPRALKLGDAAAEGREQTEIQSARSTGSSGSADRSRCAGIPSSRRSSRSTGTCER